MLMRLYYSLMPKIYNFQSITYYSLPIFIRGQFYKNVFYTPYIQLKTISQQLLSHMKFLKRKQTVNNNDLRSLTDKIVLTYVNNYNNEHPQQPDCGYAVNYKCLPCPFGGISSYLVYCKNHTRFVPVMFIQGELNLPSTTAAAIWSLMNQKQAQLHGYAIQTNGSKWQMARVTRNMHFEKTPMFEPKNIFKRAYQDQQFIQMAMGMIEEGLQVNDLKKKALITAYNYIDQKVNHFELPQGVPKQKQPWVKRLINKWVK